MSVSKSKPESGGSGDSKRGGTNARGSSATSPNDLVAELVRQARRAEPVDRIVRTADRARRTVGVGPAFPILGYDELTAGQVNHRLGGLTPPQLRKVRDYERRHANRKTVLEAIEKAL
jgi:hypothetical protein